MLEGDRRLVVAPGGCRQAHQPRLGWETGRGGKHPARRVRLDDEPLALAGPHHGQASGESGHAARAHRGYGDNAH